MPLSSPKQRETPVSVSKSSAQHDATPSPSSLTPLAAHTTPGEEVSTLKQGATRDEKEATDGGRVEGDCSWFQEQTCGLILEYNASPPKQQQQQQQQPLNSQNSVKPEIHRLKKEKKQEEKFQPQPQQLITLPSPTCSPQPSPTLMQRRVLDIGLVD
ncbi:hypothetical protein E2C01_083036 [Portunus trituberculatus]|uniref:Uncharacterized protein n=1 Tax=Portunus trituberculatus TaxID=210409 RepID=A0A5B7IW46_PORTR|nr:hypothetical protein [Portunus trituberculatus]